MVLRNLDSHMQKKETRPLYYHTQKPNSKLFKDLKVRLETIRLLGGNPLDIGLGNDFLNLTPKAKSTRAKINT